MIHFDAIEYEFFVSFSLAIVSETFSERVVINFKLSDFLILICSDCDEFSFFEHKRFKFTPGQL